MLRQSAPPENFSQKAWLTSFDPKGKERTRREAWGGGQYAAAYDQASPCRFAMFPQIRLEPILKKRAEKLNPDGILYLHKVDSVSEHGSGVTVL